MLYGRERIDVKGSDGEGMGVKERGETVEVQHELRGNNLIFGVML